MNSLLDDIKAEREQVTTEVRSLAHLMFVEMCGEVNKVHGCRPVVAALVGDQTELHFPTWNTPSQKLAAFATISDGLIERQASAAVCGFSGSLSDGTQRAVVITVQTLDWKSMTIQPFTLDKNKVQWKEPFTTTEFESPLIEISCAN